MVIRHVLGRYLKNSRNGLLVAINQVSNHFSNLQNDGKVALMYISKSVCVRVCVHTLWLMRTTAISALLVKDLKASSMSLTAVSESGTETHHLAIGPFTACSTSAKDVLSVHNPFQIGIIMYWENYCTPTFVDH